MKLASFFVLLLAVNYVQGCHWPFRKKRDTSAGLQSFFVGCLLDEISQNTDFAVEFVIDDSSWFEINNAINCINDDGTDTPDCWNANLAQYFNSNSQFLAASQECVDQYDLIQGKKKKKRSLSDFGLPVSPFGRQSDRFRMRLYSQCLSREEVERTDRNYFALSAFVRDETRFGCELCPGRCEDITQLEGYSPRLIPPSWPCMFLQQTKNTSTLRQPIETCNQRFYPEPIWGEWQKWSPCDEGCNESNQTRTRTCFSQIIKKQSIPDLWCIGSSTETRKCESSGCDGWADWQTWSKCRSNCMRSRSRKCRGEICEGNSEQSIFCLTDACGVSWGNWGSYSECESVGRRCSQTRSRSCERFRSKVDVKICVECFDGEATERRECSPSECSVFTWSPWSDYSPCRPARFRSPIWTKRRTRSCLREKREVNSRLCEGLDTETKSCNICTVRCFVG